MSRLKVDLDSRERQPHSSHLSAEQNYAIPRHIRIESAREVIVPVGGRE